MKDGFLLTLFLREIRLDSFWCVLFSCLLLWQVVMQTLENRGAGFYANGCAGHVNGSELTRMKEVAFKKDPSEPMVSTHPGWRADIRLMFRCALLIPPCCLCRSSTGGHAEIKRKTALHSGQDIARRNDPQTRWLFSLGCVSSDVGEFPDRCLHAFI